MVWSLHHHSTLLITRRAGNSASPSDPALILLSSGKQLPSPCSFLSDDAITAPPYGGSRGQALRVGKDGACPIALQNATKSEPQRVSRVKG